MYGNKGRGWIYQRKNRTEGNFPIYVIQSPLICDNNVKISFSVLDEEAKCPFSDVETGAWYEAHVATAKKLGIALGKTNITFEPFSKLTRQEMMTFTARALVKIGRYYYPNAEEIHNLLRNYSDENEISDYDFIKSIALNVQLGIVGGSKQDDVRWMLFPKAEIKRGEVAKILAIAMEKR